MKLELGYEVVNAEHPEYIDEIRECFFSALSDSFSLQSSDIQQGLNYFHQHVGEMSASEINARRISLIEKVTECCDVQERVFRAFEQTITGLLGPDILAQSTTNVVLQVPHDPIPTQLHRDAPMNSPYELVVWIPLVDCYGTKSMYILTDEQTEKALLRLSEAPADWEDFEAHVSAMATTPIVNYRQALFFLPGCLHGSHINRECETRVSLNIRYKGLFAPSGKKNQLSFFYPLRVSPLARIGGRIEARELLS
jgi:sporadic carbohydrate cluster 2OG-Fe(II) oxygenase